MAFGDRGQAQSRNLLMWGGQRGQLGGGPRPAETPTWNYTPWLNIAFLFFAAALQRGLLPAHLRRLSHGHGHPVASVAASGS